MDIIQGIIIWLVQGLTEFLPVSSSVHLVFIQHILGVGENNLAFDVLLHLGILIAAVIYYIKDIVKMIEAIGLVCYCWYSSCWIYRYSF
ncbi:MAG: Pseudogene of undecaprenyl-diphosphate phosphatase [Methanobrevibacter sp. CfCl-M3]